MRGKAVSHAKTQRSKRITPAYAGKRKLNRIHLDEKQDHPRLCGEKHVFPAVAVFVLGSPPPMRGKAGKG